MKSTDIILGALIAGLAASIGYTCSTLFEGEEVYTVKVKSGNDIAIYRVRINDGTMKIFSISKDVPKRFINCFHDALIKHLAACSFKNIHELVHFIRCRDSSYEVNVKKG